MARFYSARSLAAAHDVSPSTANRHWHEFPNGVDERGRRYVDIPDGAVLRRYPRSPRAPLTVMEHPAPSFGAAGATLETDGSLVVALVRELEARTRQIDTLLDMLRRQQ